MKKNAKKNKTQKEFGSLLFYIAVCAVSLILYEAVLFLQLGKIDSSILFFLFFIPAEAAFLSAFCGIGNRLSSRISLPVVLLLPAVYYIIQTVYITNFGTLFSMSMTGMGTNAIGEFGWALTDSIIKSIPRIIILLLPAILSALCIGIKPVRKFIKSLSKGRIRVMPYKWYIHFAVLLLSVVLWVMGIGGIRLFGQKRPSPYYLMTSSNVTTDAAAHKLGALTTALVEAKSFFIPNGEDEDDLVIMEEENRLAAWEEKIDEKDMSQGIADSDEESVEEIERVPWINEEIDFNQVAQWAEGKEKITKSIAEFLANRKPSQTNEYTGMFEGYNLIYICAESFWNYACNPRVTPTLYKMANNGIVLNNYYNSFYNTTTNGEYAFSTGLWPDVSRNSKNGTDVGSFAQSASKYMPQGMGDLFNAQGVPSYGFHNYYGKYYRRILSWPNLGYKCRFTGDNMWFTSNWPASDLELMQQTVDDYISDDRFNVYYMTFSGHGPFTSSNYMFNKNIDEVTARLGEDKYNPDARGYFCGELELDKAMEYLLSRLEEVGKLDNTVIVIAADHYPYYLSNEGLVSLTGNEHPDMDFDIYKSSCIIYNAGMEEPLQVDDYCSNVDIAPTVLNLFNIPFDSRMMMGRDIFSEEAHKRATLYNMSFISDLVRYNYDKDEAVWTAEGNKLSDIEKEKYLDSQLAGIENEYNVSCKMISDNFFLKAYEACGLLGGEELKAELAREASVTEEDESMNQADEIDRLKREFKEQYPMLEDQQILDIINAAMLLEEGVQGEVPGGVIGGFTDELAGNQAVPIEVLIEQMIQEQFPGMLSQDQIMQEQMLQDQTLQEQMLQNQTLQEQMLQNQTLQGQELQEVVP